MGALAVVPFYPRPEEVLRRDYLLAVNRYLSAARIKPVWKIDHLNKKKVCRTSKIKSVHYDYSLIKTMKGVL